MSPSRGTVLSTAIDPAAVLKLTAEAKRNLLDALLTDFGAHGGLHLELPNGPERIDRPMPSARELSVEAPRNATLEELAEAVRRANDPDSEFMCFEEVLKIGTADEQPMTAPPPRASA